MTQDSVGDFSEELIAEHRAANAEIDRLRALLRDVARTAPYVTAATRDAILDYLDAVEGRRIGEPSESGR